MSGHAKKITVCGRVHLGPCCVNDLRADGTRGPTCQACGQPLTQAERVVIQQMWNKVQLMLAPYREKQ